MEVSNPGLGPHSRLGIPPQTPMVLWSPGPVWFPEWYTQKATKTPGNGGPARGVVAKVMDQRSSDVGSNPARGPCLTPGLGTSRDPRCQRTRGHGALSRTRGPCLTPGLGTSRDPRCQRTRGHGALSRTRGPCLTPGLGTSRDPRCQRTRGHGALSRTRGPCLTPGFDASFPGYIHPVTPPLVLEVLGPQLEASFPGWNMREWAQEYQGKNHRSPPGKSLRSRFIARSPQTRPPSGKARAPAVERSRVGTSRHPLVPLWSTRRGRVVKVMDWSAGVAGSNPAPVMGVINPGLMPPSLAIYIQCLGPQLEPSFPGWNMREWAQENQGKNHRSPPGKSLRSRVGDFQILPGSYIDLKAPIKRGAPPVVEWLRFDASFPGYIHPVTPPLVLEVLGPQFEASFPGWNMREWAQENQGKNHRSPPGKSLRSRVGDFQILPGSYINLKGPIKRGPPLDPARGRVVKVMDCCASSPGSKPGDTIDGLRQIFKSAARTRPVMVVLKPGLSPDSRIGYFQ
uniref:Uncharacterized protein n=1 Tax=Knipowitschia caucasica TaxID=637954 RepID=A0AAV2K540_KNICA